LLLLCFIRRQIRTLAHDIEEEEMGGGGFPGGMEQADIMR